MKTFSASQAAVYAATCATLAYCIRLQRTDGQVFCFTSLDIDLPVGSEIYRAGPGFDVSEIQFAAGLAPDNLELRIMYDGGSFSRADLLAGKWDSATYRIFEVDYTNTALFQNTLSIGRTGEVKVTSNDGFILELRSLKQFLQRPRGIIAQKTCRHRLGDAKCRVNLAPFTFTGVAVTTATSSRQFTASSRAEAAGYFQEGELTFSTGPNTGFRRKIKSFGSGGVFELIEALPYTVEVGHQFTCIAGCLKRLEDCSSKFGNVLNFGGEPHLRGPDSLTSVPTPGA